MVEVMLPWPVSANRYWRIFRGRQVVSAEARAYKRAAGLMAKAAGLRAPLTGDVALSITLHPKLTKKGAASRVRPDLDNCCKVVFDGLNGIAYIDDSQVVKILAEIGPPVEDGALRVSVSQS